MSSDGVARATHGARMAASTVPPAKVFEVKSRLVPRGRLPHAARRGASDAQPARAPIAHASQGTKLAPNPRDPLYHETTTTRLVDFHSFRRAFNTALA